VPCVVDSAATQGTFTSSGASYQRLIEEFTTLLQAQVIIETWRIEYNTYRPHSSVGGITPADYAEQYTTINQPALP